MGHTATEVSSDPVLSDILRRLVAAYRPKQVFLLGSRARQTTTADSDYDLLLVVPNDAPPERRRSRLAYETLRGTGVAVDVLVWRQEDFEARLSLRASLPATVVAEGKLVYAA
jgi:predicted nucleotidyltransferase